VRVSNAQYVPAIDHEMHWLGTPEHHEVSDAMLTITAPAGTDRFVDPGGLAPTLQAPALVMPEPDEDYLLSARVGVAFASTFDAGVLLLWQGPGRFAKLCFELAPEHRPMVVSVVTRGTSDDANGRLVAGGAQWLRIARIGPAYAFHSSDDGQRWELARSFRLDGEGPTSVGFAAQAPTGNACRVQFDDLRFGPGHLGALRDGS
jgi:uncharacterized protein